jgi:hypothetical protein
MQNLQPGPAILDRDRALVAQMVMNQGKGVNPPTLSCDRFSGRLERFERAKKRDVVVALAAARRFELCIARVAVEH